MQGLGVTQFDGYLTSVDRGVRHAQDSTDSNLPRFPLTTIRRQQPRIVSVRPVLVRLPAEGSTSNSAKPCGP